MSGQHLFLKHPNRKHMGLGLFLALICPLTVGGGQLQKFLQDSAEGTAGFITQLPLLLSLLIGPFVAVWFSVKQLQNRSLTLGSIFRSALTGITLFHLVMIICQVAAFLGLKSDVNIFNDPYLTGLFLGTHLAIWILLLTPLVLASSVLFRVSALTKTPQEHPMAVFS